MHIFPKQYSSNCKLRCCCRRVILDTFRQMLCFRTYNNTSPHDFALLFVVWKSRNYFKAQRYNVSICSNIITTAYLCDSWTSVVSVVCPSPPVIENGAPDLAVLPNIMDVGDSLTYKCNEGYSFKSDATTERLVTCLEGPFYSAIENCLRESMLPATGTQYLNTFSEEVLWDL